jgi:hypothetical protein
MNMKENAMLALASLFSVLLMTFHLADDIVRGMEKGGPSNLLAVPILVAWLYGALVLTNRRSGYVIVLLGSLLGAVIPVVHFTKVGGVAGGAVASSSGSLFFVWAQIALGVSSVFSVVLSARGLWRQLRQSQPPA